MKHLTHTPARAALAFALAIVCWRSTIDSGGQVALAQQPAGPAEDKEPQLPPAKPGYMGARSPPRCTTWGLPGCCASLANGKKIARCCWGRSNVKPGQVVCDIGCGNGFYTLQLAKLVGPTGRVLAVDIQPEMLHLLDERAKEAGITNIELLQGTQIDPKLEPGSVDLILLVDVYHEFSHPEQMLQAMRTALKPEGRIALAEFRMEDRSVPIKQLHKMSKKQILREFPANDLKLVEEFDKLPWQHLMFFGREEGETTGQ